MLVVQLLAFTPWLALPAAGALLLALLGRSRWQQVLAAALVLLQIFWLVPLDTPRPAAAAARPEVQMTVMTINAEFGQADARDIVRLVRDNGVTLLAVQEHTQDFQDRLSTEGLDRLLPNRVSEPSSNAGGSAVYSSHPMALVGVVPDTPFWMPMVRLTAGSGGASAVVEVTNVHAVPPVDDKVAQWRSDLAAVGRVAALPGNALLLGDFNATYDHTEFRDVLAVRTRSQGTTGKNPRRDGESSSLVDVGAASGSRLVPTWPMEGAPLPGITIDHVVTSPGMGSSDYRVHRVSGSDHAAVLATLAIPAN